MPIKHYRVAEGGGTLTIGETGAPVDFTSQVKSCVVQWSKNQADSTKVLSNETLAGDTTYSASLAATLIQDLTDDGLVDYTWANKGTEVPFTYVPSSAAGRSITGVVTVDPINVGGEAGAKAPTSDIEWACVGEPTITTDLT